MNGPRKQRTPSHITGYRSGIVCLRCGASIDDTLGDFAAWQRRVDAFVDRHEHCGEGPVSFFPRAVAPLAGRDCSGMGYSGDPSLSEYANATQEGRTMRLKGYGNAINVETARMFIEAAELSLLEP